MARADAGESWFTLADGSVRFVDENLALSVLQRLAIRDDGLPASLP